MKKAFCILLGIILGLAMTGSVLAEDTAEYRDDVYSFRYPAAWSQATADNGDIVIGSPDGSNAVLTFAIRSDLTQFSGDTEPDASTMEMYISQYGGKNLVLNGEYEAIRTGELVGYRVFGTWKASGQKAELILLTGSRHMVGFVFVGDGALEKERVFLDSIELQGNTSAGSTEGFTRWEGTQFALNYPETYGIMEQKTGIVCINPNDSSNIIMARTYSLDMDYSDETAPIIAANALPKSTKVEANPEMTEIGGRAAAVIMGTVANGPMHFYVIGSGRTAMALMFTGEESVGYAEAVIRSVEIH